MRKVKIPVPPRSVQKAIASILAASTGTKMPRTNWTDMARYDIVLPDRRLVKTLSNLVMLTVDKMRANIHESRTLAATRDALLPKLLSGEIRVKCRS